MTLTSTFLLHSVIGNRPASYARVLLAIIFAFSFSYGAHAQTVLVDPAGAGGFELGSSFADNGWTVSNGSNNPWVLGLANTTAPFAGYSAYISTDGITPGYLNTAAASNFFWRDIVVPAGQERVDVSFNWLSGGESTTSFFDCWQVFFVPSTTTPVGVTTSPGSGLALVPSSLSGGIFVGGGNLQTAAVQTFSGAAYLPAGSYRIVFHWKNDGSGGTTPGASIDNISVSSQATSTFTSVASGNWSDAATWGGSAPSAADNAIIASGHTVTINALGQSAQNVTVAGTLTYGTTPTEFQVKDLTVVPDGLVNVFSGTAGKILRVRGDLVNNGRVNTLASSTANGTLNLNGTSPQTVSGSGAWGGTVSSTTSTNEVGVIGVLSVTNTSTSIPRINYTMGGTLRVRSTFSVSGAINLNGSTWIAGNYAAMGSLTFSNNGGFINGTYGRWYTTAQTGTTITAGVDPSVSTSSALSLFPMLNSNGVPRYCWITRSSSTTTGNTAGEIRVTYTNEGVALTGNAFTDGSYNVNKYWPGTWSVTTASGYVYASGTHSLVTMVPGLYIAANGNARLMVNGGTFVGNHQLGSLTPGAQRTGLSTVQLTSIGGFVMGLNESDECSVTVANIPYNEGFETGQVHNSSLGGCFLTQASVSGSNPWTANNTFTDYNRTPRSGAWSAFLRYSNTRWLFIPLNLTANISYTFSMYARQDGTDPLNASVAVSYGTSGNAAAMTNPIIASTGVVNGNYQLLTGTFTPSTSGVYFVGINGTINGTPWYITIDDISVIETPACVPPSGLTSSSVTNLGATLAWSASASSNNYEVVVQAAGAGAPSGAGVAVTGTTYSATALNAATNYEFYVRTVCPSDNSPWSGPVTFSTAVCASSATCNYTINMTDTYGDGWDGTVIGLRQSGILVGSFGGAAFATGASATATVALCPDLLTEIVLVTPGLYPEEKRFTIVDPFGVQVYALSTATTPHPSSFGTFTSSCTPPACAIPTALASSSISASGATIAWTAGGSEASWEISIQAPGLGAPTGNGTSITTNPYVATGLTSNTSYQVYLRAVCSPTNKSNWVGPISFRTLCDVFTLPFFESFETAQGTASCWSGNLAAGSTPGWQWIRISTGSAPSNQNPALPDTLAFRIPFYNIVSGSFSLNTPVFVASAGLSTVSFNYAYAAYSAAENDQLEIMGSTDGGTTYTTLELMNGGPSGPLNTGGTTTSSFVPTVSQWGTKTILLPAGTNRISFKGISAYGNNLYIDNVRLAEVPPCLSPSNVSIASSGVSARGASVSWDAPSSAPTNGYGLIVSTTNSAPAAGAASTSNAASSPAVLSGLTPNTTYYVWVRSLCAFNASDWVGGVAFTTSCDTSAIPFAENFDAVTPAALPGVVPTCWSRTTNVSPWRVSSSSSVGSVSAPNMVWTTYNSTSAKNDWIYTPGFALNAGISYALRFQVRAPGWLGTPEKLAVYVSNASNPTSMIAGSKIYENLNLTTSAWVEVLTTFTPSTTGTYFIGWHAFSAADIDYIAIDNVSLGFTPPSPIAGIVRYGNTAQTPLSNVKVTLWNTSNNTPVDSLTTDASGAYSFTPGPGSFEVRSSTSRTPGGWNATGALAIGRHYANVNPLQGLYLSAADVTANSQVNASDALQVLLRYLTVTNSFAAGSWVFEKPSVTVVQGATVPAYNITGLSVGDVRGAFTPGARLTSKAKIESGKDELLLTSGQIVRIPVYIDEEIDLGAISLALGYDARQLEVLSVRLSDAAHNANMVARVSEPGIVSLAWFDVQGWDVQKGSVLFELECLVKNVDANGVSFRVMEGSELASKEVEVLDMAKLRIPGSRGTEGVNFISLSNYPNPFDGHTSLRFNLPTEGSVVLRVLDVAGREVATYDLGTRAAGLHTQDLELNVQAGVYSAELLFNRSGESTVAVTRMIRR